MTKTRQGWLTALIGCSCAAAMGIAPAQTVNEIVLHNFGAPPNGMQPWAGVIRDLAGNLYGTTYEGGSANKGVVYKVGPGGRATVLYSFTGGADGGHPYAGVIADPSGNLYGTTYEGGATDVGVVYRLDTSGHQTVLYDFAGRANGAYPSAGVIRDSAGNLYGTTGYGGPLGWGEVFRLDPSGNLTVLHAFTGGTDGGTPVAGVIRDSEGNLYGTTSSGGTSDGGVVFRLDPSGNLTVLHDFTGGTDGTNPNGV